MVSNIDLYPEIHAVDMMTIFFFDFLPCTNIYKLSSNLWIINQAFFSILLSQNNIAFELTFTEQI